MRKKSMSNLAWLPSLVTARELYTNQIYNRIKQETNNNPYDTPPYIKKPKKNTSFGIDMRKKKIQCQFSRVYRAQ